MAILRCCSIPKNASNASVHIFKFSRCLALVKIGSSVLTPEKLKRVLGPSSNELHCARSVSVAPRTAYIERIRLRGDLMCIFHK